MGGTFRLGIPFLHPHVLPPREFTLYYMLDAQLSLLNVYHTENANSSYGDCSGC